MSLLNKYRPRKFKSVVGNRAVVASIKRLVSSPDSPRSWLFTGRSGVGKTTLARIVAAKAGAAAPGIQEINAADIRGIEGMRLVTEQAQYPPVGSPVVVFILDECHQLTNAAQNMLLKVLEDTPRHAMFVLCTTDPEKLLGTIRTRCAEFRLRPVGDAEVRGLLARVSAAEDFDVSDGVLDLIVSNAAGSPRLALNMLAKCSGCDDEDSAKDMIAGLGIDFQTGDDSGAVRGIVAALLDDSASVGRRWRKIAVLLSAAYSKNENFDSLRRGVTGYMGSMLMRGDDARLADAILVIDGACGYGAASSSVVAASLRKALDALSRREKPTRKRPAGRIM